MTVGTDVETRLRREARAPVNHGARVVFLLLALLASYGAALARAWQLQVLSGGELRARAERLHRGVATELFYRSSILDRNGGELAKAVSVESAYADPRAVRDRSGVAARLSLALGLDPGDVEKKLSRASAFVWLKHQLSPLEKDRLQALSLEGVGLKREATRYYPNGDLAAHVIGFVGADGRGLEGLELAEDSVLGGSPVERFVQRDARRRLFDLAETPEPADGGLDHGGAEVRLTIDRGLQHLLQDALEGAARDSGAKGAMGVMLDPRTAEVLALANWPTYNPGSFALASPEARRNRAITDSFEPGSTLKVFLAAAALESGIDPAERVYCERGAYHTAGAVIHDHDRYEWLTLQQVVQVSSNIGAAKIAERIGARRLHGTLRSFGFGERTGIELPGEVAGSLRPISRWSAVDLRTAAFGQGVSVTALQLAAALAAIANGGVLLPPTIIREVRTAVGPDDAQDPSTPASRPANSNAAGIRVISKETARRVAAWMTTVTQDGGTGKLAAVDGFEVAGKTGTAEKVDPLTRRYSEKGRVSSFMGFVPAEDPRLVIVIVVDEPSGKAYGGLVAAPAFREVAQAALSYLKVPSAQSPPSVEPPLLAKNDALALPPPTSGVAAAGDASPREGTAEGMPDFRGKTMREVVREASRLRLKLKVEGTGLATDQEPKPGTNLAPGARGRVGFSPPA